jgi:DNA mismatch endonuclease (patch repair protein)
LDHVSPEIRSRIMSAVHTRNTTPEMSVRRIVHKMGYRFRLHVSSLPGKPDLVFAGKRKLIFVHGCFWHGHNCKYGQLPKTKTEYWAAKIAKNKSRDRIQCQRLRKLGWDVLVVWQCSLKNQPVIQKRIERFLSDAKAHSY